MKNETRLNENEMGVALEVDCDSFMSRATQTGVIKRAWTFHASSQISSFIRIHTIFDIL
jgi:hypothetical protein